MSDPTAFDTLNLKPELLGNLGDLGYVEMTLVQAHTLPRILAGADVLARAKTGSGKTAAFGLGLLNKLDAASFRTQALVLCPTRELADQVAKEIRRLARAVGNVKILTLCGGVPLGPQIASLQHHPHIVVGTPGRVLKHLGKATLSLKSLQTFVLDEADRMLDMGFMDELDAILAYVPAARQTLLFSATYPKAIAKISAKVQRNPQKIDVTDDERPAQITQYWCSVTRENRCGELVRALRAWGGELNLVFCNTKIDCADVAAYLQSQKIVAVALHGDLDQPQRTEVLVRFANRSASVLIATDVAARGLDVKDLDAVFNFEPPKQADVYVHRIGRTGRAGKAGVAVSLVEQREEWRLQGIEELLPDANLQHRGIPDASRSADPLLPAMTTIQISGGRKNKLRPGDLLGALTAEGGVPGEAVGSIDLFDVCSYVAVRNTDVAKALRQLSNRPIKGRKYRARVRK
ncbi:MAG: ATP-dependent RNA helicase DbpA [Gammaproteobacteria bacterium]|nr:ATP-dependent RNA helicase DbpA [Gammaproteobacteria bacterium]MDH3417188.1 ATP-dependent RNA helicase DbpA [Gammaproteobacteria bacterium]